MNDLHQLNLTMKPRGIDCSNLNLPNSLLKTCQKAGTIKNYGGNESIESVRPAGEGKLLKKILIGKRTRNEVAKWPIVFEPLRGFFPFNDGILRKIIIEVDHSHIACFGPNRYKKFRGNRYWFYEESRKCSRSLDDLSRRSPETTKNSLKKACGFVTKESIRFGDFLRRVPAGTHSANDLLHSRHPSVRTLNIRLRLAHVYRACIGSVSTSSDECRSDAGTRQDYL